MTNTAVTSTTSTDHLVDLVRNVQLTPTQRSIVRTLIAHSERAPYLSTTELAELAHVSQPSVTRLAVALGFRGYPQLRAALRASAATNHSGPAVAPANDWQRSIDFEIAALGQLRESLRDETQVRRIATEFMDSSPLVVAGHRSAGSLAYYFTFFASRIHADVRGVPMDSARSGGDLDVLQEAHTAGATAALVMAFPRYPRESLRFIRAAKEIGLRVVGLTDTVVSPLAQEVDELLIAPVDSSLIFDSHASPMIVLNVLLAAMSEVRPDDTQRRLEEFDAMAERYRLFTQSDGGPVTAG